MEERRCRQRWCRKRDREYRRIWIPCIKKGVQGDKRGHLLVKEAGDHSTSNLYEVHTIHREIAYGEDIVRYDAFNVTGTIVEFETSSVGLVSCRVSRIVSRVSQAREGHALGAGDTKVTRSTTGKR